MTFTPIRLKVSDCDHVGRHVKKCPKNHIILRKTSCFKSNHDLVKSKFSIIGVASVLAAIHSPRFGSENHYPWEFNIVLKALTSWAQRDKTLQETVTFTDKKKTAYNYSDPGGTLEKLNNLKPSFSRIEELDISKGVNENALASKGKSYADQTQ